MANLITGWTIVVFVLYFINYLLTRFFTFLFNGNKDILMKKAVKTQKNEEKSEKKGVLKIGTIGMIFISICPVLNILMCGLLAIFIFYEIIMIIALVNTINS